MKDQFAEERAALMQHAEQIIADAKTEIERRCGISTEHLRIPERYDTVLREVSERVRIETAILARLCAELPPPPQMVVIDEITDVTPEMFERWKRTLA
jgi:hypothetical protein